MLEIDRLTKFYGEREALLDLSFAVNPGERVALLGRNGAGKSTTFLCMSGLVRPDSGRVLLDGNVLGSRRAQSIALVPETPEVYDALTVWEHMVLTALSCEIPDGWERRAEILLERLDLVSHRNILGAALSKGMRQKTLIAATLLADAPVLLLDEPMVGLDPAGQREVATMIADLSNQGKMILISTHQLATAQAIADRVLTLRQGTCVYDGPFASFPKGRDESLESAFLKLTA